MENEPIWELQEAATVRPKLTMAQIRLRVFNFYRDGLWDAAEVMNYINGRNLWPINDADWEGRWGRFISELNDLVVDDDPPPLSGALAAPVTSHNSSLTGDSDRDMTPYGRRVA